MIWKNIPKLSNFVDPEFAHNLAILFLKLGVYPKIKNENLPVKVKNLLFNNPIGLAAGFDKNALIIKEISDLGFGFSEIGTVTPLPQYGNRKPRIFRLKEDKAIINRNGFNNEGMIKIKERLKKYKNNVTRNKSFLIGINIGPNKNSLDRIEDYKLLAYELGSYADYITINVSSPNTVGLRRLQSIKFLKHVINSVNDGLLQNNCNLLKKPVFIKISPDIETNLMRNIIKLCVNENISGLIISNTTINRPRTLKSDKKKEIGGLSGSPLFSKSTELLIEANRMKKKFKANIFLIATGGVIDGFSAYVKILSGAHLIQLYTSLAYKGPIISKSILNELKTYLVRDNIKNLDKIRGIAHSFEEAILIAKKGF